MMRCRWLFLSLPLLLMGCSPAPPEQLSVPSVLLFQVTEANHKKGRQFTGEIVPRHTSTLGFRIGGKLMERFVDVGSRVKRGQLLARLDAKDTALSLTAAQAALDAARSDLELAQTELRRVRALREKKFVSDSVVDTQVTATHAAEARIRQAEAEVELAANQNTYATLRADADGVVTTVNAEVGQVMATGQPLVTLAQDGPREVRINVPETDLSSVHVGGTAQVHLWSAPEQNYPAKVRELAPAADAVTRTYTAKARIEAEEENLPLGATATVVMAAEPQESLRLPLRALGQREGQPVVWVFDAKTDMVGPIPVRLVRFDEHWAFVEAEGLQGKQVVSAGIHLLQPGMKVHAVAETESVKLDLTR